MWSHGRAAPAGRAALRGASVSPLQPRPPSATAPGRPPCLLLQTWGHSTGPEERRALVLLPGHLPPGTPRPAARALNGDSV